MDDSGKIQRIYEKTLLDSTQKGKVIILYGPRRVGKTYLLHELYGRSFDQVLFLNGEEQAVKDGFEPGYVERLKGYIGNAKIVVIDEAQKIPKIGDVLKFAVDNFPDVAFVASGSASFDLSQKVGEPLTGRKKTYILFPVSAKELCLTYSPAKYMEKLEDVLLYGSYPEIFSFSSREERIKYLHELVDSYLLKDILELEQIRNAKKLRDLLALLAHQIGQEVSHTELANALDISKNTVARYLDLLEKSFVILNIRGFSRNLRKEVSKNSRYYFIDNGIRNALINNFNLLSLRNDIGALWENYIVMERIKKQTYDSVYSSNYFWRTYDKKEIDLVEERSGNLYGYEIKWNEKESKAPREWLATYPNASYETINKKNFLAFVS